MKREKVCNFIWDNFDIVDWFIRMECLLRQYCDFKGRFYGGNV